MFSSLDVWPLLLVGAISLVAWARAFLRTRESARADEEASLLLFAHSPRLAQPTAPAVPHALPAELVASPVPEDAPPVPAPTGWGAFESGHTIAVSPAMDGTVQLLPGWLEVVRGHTVDGEIRFVRMSGDAMPQITLGRAEGAEFHHIQIPERTVSRLHAKMCYQDRLWRIANLSSTNPVRVNGRTLGGEDWVVLGDGDQVALGSVELRFHKGPA